MSGNQRFRSPRRAVRASMAAIWPCERRKLSASGVVMLNVTDTGANVLADTPVSMKILVGDTNASSAVSAADVGQTKSQSGLGTTGTNFRTDINASGSISAADVAQVKANSGHSAF